MLKARYVFPVTADPIPDGVVVIEHDRIVAINEGVRADEAEDLGNVALLPGLVNAHTHLEFSDLPAPLARPGVGLVDWIETVLAWRRRVANTVRRPVELGLEECARQGVTAVGEIAQPNWPTGAFERSGLDAMVFLELIAPTAARVAPMLAQAQEHLALPPSPRIRGGLCLHAPYTVHPRLLAQTAEIAAARRTPLAMHLAESREELEFLRSGSGPFRQLLESVEGWDAHAIVPGTRVLDYLRILSSAPRVLVVHGNYLDDDEIDFLSEHRHRMAVVYCPRTHAYFQHAPYPLGKLLAAGVTVALGTDSRASSPDLSVLAEMRLVARRGWASPAQTLAMGTLAGARALDMNDRLGSLDPGKLANLAIVSLPDRDAEDPYALLFDSELPVVGTCLRGSIRWAKSRDA